LTDDDLLKFLTDFRKPPTLAKKPKTIPGKSNRRCTTNIDALSSPASIRLEFSQIHPGDHVDCCLDAQLNRLKPYTDDTRRPIKELLEFPPREIYLPHTSYRNLLYLYPLSLNLSNLTTRGSTSARNIAVKVQLMGGEEEIFALPVIFGKSSGQEVYLPVLYHTK
jgi:dedicator of cytokinesis protein 6/7/8